MDTGEEKIEDQALVQQLRQQASKVQRETVAVAIALTLTALVLPAKSKRKAISD